MIFQNILRYTTPDFLIKDLDKMSPKDIMLRKAVSHSGFKFGLFLFLLITFIGVFVPFFVNLSPYEQDISNRLMPPVWSDGGSWEYIFGTDGNGRDYLARILYGTRISLTIGIGAATVGMLIGVTLGVIAGYFGGIVDQVVSYILTCQLALPGVLFLLTIISIIGSSLTVVILVIGVLHWTLFLVVTRSATQRIRNLDYITAANAIGASKTKIILTDILPNVFNQIIVIFTLEVGVAILAESTISFLGLGPTM